MQIMFLKKVVEKQLEVGWLFNVKFYNKWNFIKVKKLFYKFIRNIKQ